jgi:hypothetical protein
MPGRMVNFRNTIAAAFVANDRGTVPTVAQFNALATGISTMRVRRAFGGFLRGMRNSLARARVIDSVMTIPTPPVNQVGNEGTGLDYTPAAFTDPENATITYSASLDGGAPLPSWITFTPATRRFQGTRPPITATETITVRLTGTDIYGKTASATFLITNTNI